MDRAAPIDYRRPSTGRRISLGRRLQRWSQTDHGQYAAVFFLLAVTLTASWRWYRHEHRERTEREIRAEWELEATKRFLDRYEPVRQP